MRLEIGALEMGNTPLPRLLSAIVNTHQSICISHIPLLRRGALPHPSNRQFFLPDGNSFFPPSIHSSKRRFVLFKRPGIVRGGDSSFELLIRSSRHRFILSGGVSSWLLLV